MRELIGNGAPAQRLPAMLSRMDASVRAAMARWPDVPAVYGWLRLTARGEWRIRGEPVGNAALREFIGRNYACDARGCWFFQNGPQRVYVALDLAPQVYRVHADGLRSFTGRRPQRLLAAALVDDATVVLQTDLGAGNVDDRDAERVLPAFADGSGRSLGDDALARALGGEDLFVSAASCGLPGPPVPLQRLAAADLAGAFGFVANPQPDARG